MDQENMVVDTQLQEATFDQPQDSAAEGISQLLADTQTDTEAPQTETTEEVNGGDVPPKTEPGWIRQRIDKAVSRAVRETEQRMQAQFDAVLAPIQESILDRQAQELVSSGEFRSKEIAREYLQLKGGKAPQPAAPAEEKPQAEPKQATIDPATKAKADMLAAQAEKIKARTGIDVIKLFNEDADVRAKIFSGEADFYDIAEAVQPQRGRRATPPAPARNPNGTGTADFSIANMSDEQFKKLQQNLAHGRTYDMRK